MTKINGVDGGLDIEIDEQVAQGQYVNLAIISHSPTEFVIDFASTLPAMPKPKVANRAILAPEHAKRLLYSLQDNIARYESTHGQIKIHQREPMPAKLAPTGEA